MQSIRTKRKYNSLLSPRGRHYDIGGLIKQGNKVVGGMGSGIMAGAGALGQIGGGLIAGGL